MLKIPSATKEQKKERKLKNAVLEYFFNKYMIQEKGVTVDQNEVIEAILRFCEIRLAITKLSIDNLNLTNFLKRKGICHKYGSNRDFFGRVSWVKYMDLTLNTFLKYTNRLSVQI